MRKLEEEEEHLGDYRKAAEVALRRWQSFPRRAKMKHPTPEYRIEDLAKGLCDAFSPDRRMVGPPVEDYRDVARLLADVLQVIQRDSE